MKAMACNGTSGATGVDSRCQVLADLNSKVQYAETG
ncbi:hypothetical protein CPAR01_09978 [Colletotrichum paranaense]|uniref:Uncharacterized protein n=1 Tax=Colletotrichum paranaense TaxID=1914294 RepID=A0ABQ9SDC9_9PEZI|nr:uncharacterized protein CPAR01_09978 [Colletotrichum paranaense]KAK1533270.1 hypothetical protein CPAR01_09978 [Colletotrichum paranaense]